MKTVVLVEFSDLLWHAQSMGYEWNEAHRILSWDQIPPVNESPTYNYEIWEFNEDSHYSKETCEIMLSYFEDNDLTKFTLSM